MCLYSPGKEVWILFHVEGEDPLRKFIARPGYWVGNGWRVRSWEGRVEAG